MEVMVGKDGVNGLDLIAGRLTRAMGFEDSPYPHLLNSGRYWAVICAATVSRSTEFANERK